MSEFSPKVATRPVMLIVLDGWGSRPDAADNATTQAKTPHFTEAWETWFHAHLQASEEYVGLPKGQIGNSEVGHMNLGAGRVVYQDLPLIDRAIATGSLQKMPALQEFIQKMKDSDGTCHLMGLASPGGVHAHQDHIVALAKILYEAGVPCVVHAFLDGRDVPPRSAAEQITKLVEDLGPTPIATVCGRYYAMDRDKRWDRVQKAYDLLTQGKGRKAGSPLEAVLQSYAENVGDEFVEPFTIDDYEGMEDGDGILFANFRSDRAREILTSLLVPSFDGFAREEKIEFAAALGMVGYADWLLSYINVMFPPKDIKNGLGEIVSAHGLRQLRLAETEKYPHVTFFFNAGREQPFAGEERVMIPSPKVATYDLQPEMSAAKVTDKAVEAILSRQYGLIVMNFANPDMVGHTGDLGAAIQAVETVDACLGRIFTALAQTDGVAIVTADHGNCEVMTNPETKGPHTAHTLNPVPVLLVGMAGRVTGLRDGKLADVAPTLLELMEIEKPAEMDGESLLVR